MAVIKKIVRNLRESLMKPDEKGEYSAGYLPLLVREKATDILEFSGRKILDLGCGEGLLLRGLSEKCPDKTLFGIDPWEDILAKAKARQIRNATLMQGSSFDIPFEDETFDAVVCLNLFVNLPEKSDIILTLSEIYRVLRRGGTALFDFRNTFNPLIFFGYKLAFLHDPDIKVPLRTHTFGFLKKSLQDIGIKEVTAYPLGISIRIIAPAVLVKAVK